jgi:TetR/AcrR family transcriptional regulator, transcriptional repressor for nem operon
MANHAHNKELAYWKMTGHTRITMPRPQNPNVRKRLMAAGQQLFLTQGFNGCGVQEITSAAEVPKGSFYSYFETKEAFALAVLEEFWIGVEKKFGGILRDAALKPVERVARYFKALSDDKARHNYAHGCLIGNCSLEMTDVSADTRAKLSDIFERWENPIITCLREAQSKKEIAANHDLRDLAASIIESWEGAVMRAKVEQRRSAYRRFEEIVLPSLLKR